MKCALKNIFSIFLLLFVLFFLDTGCKKTTAYYEKILPPGNEYNEEFVKLFYAKSLIDSFQ